MANKKIIDVAKPDSTPATTTSKPVIVGHKPIVVDPMVNEDKLEADKTAAKPEPKSPSSGEKKLQPLSAEFKREEPAEPETDKEPTRPKDEAAEKPAPATESEENADEDSDDGEADEDAEDKLANQEVSIEDERQAQLKELIESKKYNVSFDKASKASARTFFVTVITVLLVGAAALLLLDDAGIIDLGLQLPFDLIK